MFITDKIYKPSILEVPQLQVRNWIKMWYIYTMEYYSVIKKNKIMPFAAIWIYLETVILSELSQTKTDPIEYHSYVESKRKVTFELIYKTEVESQM